MARHFLIAMVLAAALCPAARAQLGDQIPSAPYYGAVEELYNGQYRDAERDFRRLGRTGVQSGQARWIDAICYHAMLGEALYQQGRNGDM